MSKKEYAVQVTAHGSDDLDRAYTTSLSAKDWLWLYDRSKKSYLQYGAEGPPVGSTVTTLFAGHGGGPGSIRRFEDIHDDRWFYLSNRESNGRGISLVFRDQWWREIAPGTLPWRGPESVPWR